MLMVAFSDKGYFLIFIVVYETTIPIIIFSKNNDFKLSFIIILNIFNFYFYLIKIKKILTINIIISLIRY